VARRYDAEGPDELAFLDIRASIERAGLLYEMIEAVADQVFIPLTVGGGVDSIDDIRALLNAGADKVSINTAGVKTPTFIAEASRISAPRRSSLRSMSSNAASTNGRSTFTAGRTATGIDAVEWAAEAATLGAGELLLTSMDRDGARSGFDFAAHACGRQHSSRCRSFASGGVGTLQDLVDGIAVGGADAVLAASIFHYGEFTVGQAKAAMAAAGIEIRTLS
jgi:cyclase